MRNSCTIILKIASKTVCRGIFSISMNFAAPGCCMHSFTNLVDPPSKMSFEFLRLSWTPSSCTSTPESLLRTLLLATRPAETFVTESRGVAIGASFGTLPHLTRPTATATCSQSRPLHNWRCSHLIKMAWHTNTYQASNIGRIKAANIGLNNTWQCGVASQ